MAPKYIIHRLNAIQPISLCYVCVCIVLFQCSLLENTLSDIITVNLDNQGSLLGVSLRVRSPHCAGARVDDDELEEWDTFVEVIQTAQGPTYVNLHIHSRARTFTCTYTRTLTRTRTCVRYGLFAYAWSWHTCISTQCYVNYFETA